MMFFGAEVYLNSSDAETRNYPIAIMCAVNYYTTQADLIPVVFPGPHIPSCPVIIFYFFLAYILPVPSESSSTLEVLIFS